MEEEPEVPQTVSCKDNWHLRFTIGLLMIVLSIIGIVIATLRQDGAWTYWRIMVPVFAVLSLFLSWYLHRCEGTLTLRKIMSELGLWLGLGLTVYLVSVFVRLGILSRFGASLQILTLLSFTLFTAGIYVESCFLAIGPLLGLFAAGVALIAGYLYAILIPLTLVAIIALYYLVRRHRSNI